MTLEPNLQPAIAQAFTVFDTAVGACGVVWNERALLGVQLPERDAAATRARLRRRFPNAREAEPSTEVRSVIDRIAAIRVNE